MGLNDQAQMAFMDDAQFVISQIRHSCVTSDDTGKLFKIYTPISFYKV